VNPWLKALILFGVFLAGVLLSLGIGFIFAAILWWVIV
jgi:hypothetical protein